MTRSTKHFWWVWIGIEIAFVSMLFLAFPAKASPIWECKSEGGWSQSPIGDFTEIPKTDDADTNILEFQAPNKMKVIKAGSEFAQSIYEQMDWEKVGDRYYGTAVVRYGKHIFTATEVLGDTGSTVSLIFRDGEQKAIVGRNSCVKSDPTQKAAATQTPTTTNKQPTAQVAKTSQKDKSFWCKADELLKLGIDEISEKDMVTGVRSLNVMDEKAASDLGRELLANAVKEAKANNIRVFQPSESSYQRVKAISDRVIASSHYRGNPNVSYAVIDHPDFNALAYGGGTYLIYKGLMDQTNDAELAYVIAHEIAHSSAGHIHEKLALNWFKDKTGNKPHENFSASLTNTTEQEADKIAVIYTAIAGYDPCASATIWEKRQTSINELAWVRTHPANPRRAATNRQWCAVAKQYWMPGQVNPNAQNLIKCNALYCNVTREELKECEGGGILAAIEVLADSVVKNKQAKSEQKNQERQAAEAQKIIAKQQLETPPNVNWGQGWNVFRGSVVRHAVKAGLNFAIADGQGQFYYNHNGQVHQGALRMTGQNEHGYWFNWQDSFGNGSLVLKEYTDGSLRGQIFLNDGSNPGKLLGDWNGFR